jgi:tetratricopeptide (TPR) repeat protein
MVWYHPFFVLLVLLFTPGATPAWGATEFSKPVQQAYQEIIKLKVDSGRKLIRQYLQQHPDNLVALLLENYTDFLPVIFLQNPATYEAAMAAQEKRADRIKASTEKTPYKLYALAEIKIQMALCQVFHDDEIKAGWNIRQALMLLEQNQKLYPQFYPNRKSLGMLQFALGSVPDSYQWILSILGMKASIKTGIQNLKLAATNAHPFQQEALLQYQYMNDVLQRDKSTAPAYFQQLAKAHPDNLLFTFLAVALLQKHKKCDLALNLFHDRPTGSDYLPVVFMHHLAGDMYLFKGDYNRSLQENRYYLSSYAGRHYRKDSYYKMYLAAWLKQDAASAKNYLNQIGKNGTDFVEEDANAQKYYRKPEPPNPILMRARLHSDGGYYQEAAQVLADFESQPNPDLKDKIEYLYRLARVYQGLEKITEAKKYYSKTMELAGNLPYYFAPNAALQLGYIATAENDPVTAKIYFTKVLNYPKHDYKRSLDSKAKVALGAL